MSDNSSSIPVWVQIFLAFIAMLGTVAAAYLSRPLAITDIVQPQPQPLPPQSAPNPMPAPTTTNNNHSERNTEDPPQTVPATDKTEDAKSENRTPVEKPRLSLQNLIGLDIAIGDDITILNSTYPDIKWNQVKTIRLGEINGRFINRVPGKITFRVEDEKLTTVWFEMSYDGGTVRRVVDSSGDSSEEKVRNEYDTDYSYARVTSMCATTNGLRSDIIKLLGAAYQFNEETVPANLNEENLTLKYVDFEKFNAKYKLGEEVLAGVQFWSEAYIKNDTSRSGYINTKTSHRECILSVIFNRAK